MCPSASGRAAEFSRVGPQRWMRAPLFRIGLVSLIANLLAIAGSLFVCKVYDQLLAARSAALLAQLAMTAVVVIAAIAVMDALRARMLVRFGARLDSDLAPHVFTAGLTDTANGQPLRDLHALRAFVAGPTMPHLLDAPWALAFLVAIYLLHPTLGHVAAIGGALLCGLALINERTTHGALLNADQTANAATRHAVDQAQGVEAAQAMGMLSALRANWVARNDSAPRLQIGASEHAAWHAALARLLRLLVQMTMLGLGAYLVLEQRCTPGAMIAASVLSGRALAPIEGAIGGWRGFVQARAAYTRLCEVLARVQDGPGLLPALAPTGSIELDRVVARVPNIARPVIRNVSCTAIPGQCLAIVGPSGAGKSSLARVLVGVWRPSAGSVRIDGIDLPDWPREALGPHIGYLPQDVALLHGTVAENIARFGEISPSAVVDAAELAGANAMILQLPKGYDTVVGPGGHVLSGGQRQRIGLARAFYGWPAIVVLDEPTSSLDSDGEAYVCAAIEALKSRNKTVVAINPEPAVLRHADRALRLEHGRVTHFGAAHEVLADIVDIGSARDDATVQLASTGTC